MNIAKYENEVIAELYYEQTIARKAGYFLPFFANGQSIIYEL